MSDGKWILDDGKGLSSPFIYKLNKNKINKFYLSISPGFNDDGSRVSHSELMQVANLIISKLNGE